MADEVVEEEEGGGKGGLIKIILLVVGILLLVAITIGGTLFLSGFFEADEEATAEAAVAALEAIASEEAAAAAAALAGPDRVKIDSPELTRYEQTYFEIESEMTVYQDYVKCWIILARILLIQEWGPDIKANLTEIRQLMVVQVNAHQMKKGNRYPLIWLASRYQKMVSM